ncbi:uncharacterized protein LOC117502901 isoform X3 [Thalassophryne amazonica]|uniref:uncharacterized protein LOC117502901 isoform X3 n=1 Tax=Thalassophryne amazonica TaxID=390379 RepID=UPI001471A93C|nr:uncharacterized protein LOC117502901 isoform X3 [Thalassophryne amazonica]
METSSRINHREEMQHPSVIKEENFPEEQEWYLSLDQKDIKKEQEKLWTPQEGQQLHQQADINNIFLTAATVKSENDEKKPHSSQVYQSQNDESTTAELPASTSTSHRTLTAQADGVDYGGLPARHSDKMGSNTKRCPNCPQVMPCATKVCKACGTEQPKKARLKKRLQALDEKKEEWLGNLKRNHNEAAMLDEAIILLEKLHALGYKPLLLLQKDPRKGRRKPQLQALMPRCELDDIATKQLSEITASFELLCTGWKQVGTVITMSFTPYEKQGTSGEEAPGGLVKEAGPEGLMKDKVPEERVVEVVPGGLVKEEGPEGFMEDVGPEGRVVGVVPGGMVKETWPEGVMEKARLEGLDVGEPSQLLPLPKKGSTGKRRRKSEAPMRKNCSYHTGLVVFPD